MANVVPLETSASTSSDSNQTKSKKPSNSAFKQQRLVAWQPILTAGTVLPTFFVIGILFIPVGIGLWYFSDNVSEKIIDYTNCTKFNLLTGVDTGEKCADVIDDYEKSNYSARGLKFPECMCKVNFTLEKTFRGKVYIYYGLTNFYQNHRRYVKSRDDNQLYGGTEKTLSADCNPYATSGGKNIWPCGAIANSMFQDDIYLFSYQCGPSPQCPMPVDLKRTGIAWESDKAYKFKNPDNWTTEAFRTENVKPLAWRKSPWDLDPDHPENNGLQNEDFIVWMRTAALPNFRKLYRIVDQESKKGFSNGVVNGSYYLLINYTYPVTSFQGTKSVIISTTSLLGGKNPFLGISYVVVGSICLVLGIVFLFIHINCGKSTFEMTNVDPRTPY